MREKRSLFNFIFGNKKQQITQTQLQMLNGYNSQFTSFGADTYDSKVARQCIDRIATHCAKLIPKHIQNSVSNNIKGEVNFMLGNQPNPIMSTFDFIYKTISMLYTDSNAFVYIAKDSDGYITGFYPVLALSYSLLENLEGTIYLEFKFINGKTYALPYFELIHLRMFYNKNDIFGSHNKVLNTDLETAHTASEGIKNAIKISNNLKGIIHYTNSILKESDLKKSKEAFVKDFLNLENASGIAALDGKAEFKEVNLKPITLDKDQLAQVNYNIFDYYGISEKIVRNNFTSEEWNAFYEGVIEPRAIQMSYEFTNKIFNQKARKDGHRIVFSTNRLQYATVNDKVAVVAQLSPVGALKIDELRELFDLPAFGGEAGNKIVQSLNNIDSSIANQYQGGNKNGESD